MKERDEWRLEVDGPMTLTLALDELLALYDADDQYSPYLFTERRKNVLRIRCKDGSELVVRVDLRRRNLS